jgi:hypothetical protein
MNILGRLIIMGLCAGICIPLLFAQTTVDISGTVSSSRGGALSDVVVTLKNSRLSDTTDATGVYRIIGGTAPVNEHQIQFLRNPAAYFSNNTLFFSVRNNMLASLALFNTQGALVSQLLPEQIIPPNDYRFEFKRTTVADGVYYLRLMLGGKVTVFPCVLLAGTGVGIDVKGEQLISSHQSGLRKTAAVIDTLIFACSGYETLHLQTTAYTGEYNAKMWVTITHGSQLTQADVGLLGGTLTPSGTINTTEHGQVIENLSITGQIRINHDNVTVRNCLIEHGDGLDGVVVRDGNTGARIEHCEMDALDEVPGNYGSMGVVVQGNATVRRCYMHNVRSGMSILDSRGSGSFIENYVRDLCDANGAHNTSASCHGTPGPHEVLRNNFVAGNSSAYSLYSDFGSNTNVLVQDNLFVGDGTGYGVYGGYSHLDNGNAQSNRDIRFIGNRWRPPFHWGPCAAMNMDQPGAEWSDNRWEDGTVIEPKEDI